MRAVHRALYRFGFPHLGYELWWKYRCRFDTLTRWNRQNKAIFIHIPKTAGTSIYNALGMDVPPYTHVPARVLAAQHPQDFASSFRFTFVRDPWDRMVSTYEFLRNGTTWDEQKHWAREHIADRSLGDFLRKVDADQGFRAAVMSYEFFFPQTYFLTDRAGALLVDEIYRFEDIESGFAVLARRFSVDHALGHARRSSKKASFHEYYDAQTHAIVGRLYARDCQMLGYPGLSQPSGSAIAPVAPIAAYMNDIKR